MYITPKQHGGIASGEIKLKARLVDANGDTLTAPILLKLSDFTNSEAVKWVTRSARIVETGYGTAMSFVDITSRREFKRMTFTVPAYVRAGMTYAFYRSATLMFVATNADELDANDEAIRAKTAAENAETKRLAVEAAKAAIESQVTAQTIRPTVTITPTWR